RELEDIAAVAGDNVQVVVPKQSPIDDYAELLRDFGINSTKALKAAQKAIVEDPYEKKGWRWADRDRPKDTQPVEATPENRAAITGHIERLLSKLEGAKFEELNGEVCAIQLRLQRYKLDWGDFVSPAELDLLMVVVDRKRLEHFAKYKLDPSKPLGAS